ncbi:MAG: IS3 family transposase [Enterococcus lacertideformus]|uniref:IS3 family transposase n=1 Tax=Enterococcus lacertideformus TaxID=2771493 RepID=A0A931B036_9ENTE|nr:IS3 family transposase [Enterococcus lacertideformus]
MKAAIANNIHYYNHHRIKDRIKAKLTGMRLVQYRIHTSQLAK